VALGQNNGVGNRIMGDIMALGQNNGIRLVVYFDPKQEISGAQIFHVKLGFNFRLELGDVFAKYCNIIDVDKEPHRRRRQPKEDAGITQGDVKANGF
jgi:hypothetical protein